MERTESGAEAKVMRAIVAREHKRALAERREAAAARTPEPASEPSRTRWNSAPVRKRKAGAADREIAKRAAVARAQWARRHPNAAAAERQLRKARAELVDRWDHKNDGTPETHEHASRRNQGALVALYHSEAISADQLAAAVEIAEVAERIAADVTVRTASLETRIDITRRGDGTFFERLGQVRREVTYTRWRSEVHGPIGAVLDMIVGDGTGEPIGFTIVARRHRMHNRRAKRLLVDALDLWLRVAELVRKEIDRPALDAAHARLA